MTIVLLVFLLMTVRNNTIKEKSTEKNLDLIGTATNTLLILANSKECLAYDDPVMVTKENVIDIEKLELFHNNFQEIEPDCARSHEFGWRATVKQFEPEKEWNFGAKEFSTGKSMNNQVEFWIPLTIRYSEDNVKLGRMEIKIVDGELERLAGFFDWSCKMGEGNTFSIQVSVSQPVKYENGELCVGSSCRKLLCELLYFDGFEAEGVYGIEVNYQEPNKLAVGK